MDALETPRLIIRPFAMADLDAAHRVLDIDIEWSGPAFTLDQRRQRLSFYAGLAEWHDSGRLYGFRAIVLKATQDLIGLCGFHPDLWSPPMKSTFWPRLFADGAGPCDQASLELGLGYALAHSARGQGYATEAVTALLNHAFAELQINRVFSVTDHTNADSVKVMQRAGMRIARNPDAQTVWPGVVGVIENPANARTSQAGKAQ